MLSSSLPVEAVAFTTDALLAPAAAAATGTDPTRSGARRLLTALAGHNVRTPVVVASGEESGAILALLTRWGFEPVPVLQPPPDAPPEELIALVAGVAPPEHTLIVSGPAAPVRAEMAAKFAGAVMAAPDQPLAKPILAWLSSRIGTVGAAATLVAPLDPAGIDGAVQRHSQLAKPAGSLGRLEELGVQLCGISGSVPPPRPWPAAVAIFAADHGVHAQGVTPWPQEVTAQMVGNFLDQGAAVSVLCRLTGAEVVVVDVGVVGDLPPAQGLLDRKVAHGTRDLAVEAAMTEDELWQALDIGAEVASGLVTQGVRCLVAGDMGIGNTTPSTTLVVALTGRRAGDVTGPGSGLDSTAVPRKATVVAEAAARARERHGDSTFGILAEVGGLEHAALVGYILGGAALGVPVVVDGLVGASALLSAARLVPGVEASAVAGHRSGEPAAAAALDALGLPPVMDLDLRLGEGTGAVLALPALDAAARVLAEMATFAEAGITPRAMS